MPKLRSSAVRHRMAELGVSSETLAEKTGIPWGSLRNAIAGRDPLRLPRIYDLGRLLARDGEPAREVVADIVGDNNGGLPDPPPDQTKPKPKPERRKEPAEKGPRRPVRGAA